jgi:hypothetical protein
MSINLSNFQAIQVANFVRLAVPNRPVVRFSDFNQPATVAGELYTDIGSLLSIGDTASELRVLDRTITVGVSGIPAGNIAEFLDNNPRTGLIDIRQVFYDPVTQQPLNITGNPALRFRGQVDNFSMTEDWNNETRTTSFTILFNCTSQISYLRSTIAGRRTNDRDQQRVAPGDLSMSRVFTITKTQFQFGKPQ